MHKKAFTVGALIAACTLNTGCVGYPGAEYFNCKIDAISSPNIQDPLNQRITYTLVNNFKTPTGNDLLTEEFSTYTHALLQKKGFIRARDATSADIKIIISGGISSPRTTYYTHSNLTWGQTGISSSNTSGTVNSFGTINSFGNSSTLQKQSTVNYNTNYTPTYGFTEGPPQLASATTYDRFLKIDAIKNGKTIWSTTVSSTGTGSDMRMIFPNLLAAAQPYLASNTGSQITKNIQFNRPDVLFLNPPIH